MNRIAVSRRLALGLGMVASSASAALAADAYKVDTVHSALVFRIKHFNVSYFHGRFNEVSGTFSIDSADAAKSAFDLTVKTESIDSGNDKRDGHLKSPDFFNAKEFPTITFKSTQVKKTGENTFDVTGDLTLHGVKKPITVKLEQTGAGSAQGKEKLGVETTFTIKRSDYDMKYGLDNNALGDEVRITVSLEGEK